MKISRRLHIGLQRRLTVQLDSQIYHIATRSETVRRSICPSSRQIYPDRTSAPYNLIAVYIKMRHLLACKYVFRQSLAKQGECL